MTSGYTHRMSTDAGAHLTAGDTSPALPQVTHDFLTALASSTRQRIMLLFAAGAELPVGEVAERAGVSQSTASQQLQLLRRGGILISRREGKTVLYRANREGIVQALSDLQEYLRACC